MLRNQVVAHRWHKGLAPRRGIVLILLAFVCLGVLYSVTVPSFETPDEDGHYSYVRYVAQTQSLPVICVGNAPCHENRAGIVVSPYVVNHPPLYYGLAGIAISWIDTEPLESEVWHNPHFDYGVRGLRGNKNAVIHTREEAFPYTGTSLAVHIARWVSLFLGAGAVGATYLLTLELFPDRRWLALGAAAMTAFNPQFLFITARVSNDAAVASFCSLTLWATVRFWNHRQRHPQGSQWRQVVWLGSFLGFALLSKVNAIGIVPVVALVILLKAIRHRSLKSFLLWSGVAFGVAAAIAGWWYVRNGLLYGDPLLWNVHLELVPRREPTPTLEYLYHRELGGLETSFWAVFGWMNIPVAGWIYDILRVLIRVAALGLLLPVAGWTIHRLQTRNQLESGASTCDKEEQEPPVRASGHGLWIAGLWLLILFLSLLQFMRVQPGAQGRYLFPGISAISLLILLGLSQWVPRRWRGKSFHAFLAAGIAGGLFLLAIVSPFVYIAPAYAHPPILSLEQLPADRHYPRDLVRLEVDFGGQISLLGARTDKRALHPGQKAEIILCWRALAEMERDYSVFLHLFGRDDERLGQLDIYPGVGSYPTTLWEVDDIICDDYEVPLFSRVQTPVAARVEVGFYDLASMKRLPPSDSEGHPLGQVIAGRVKVVPRKWPRYEIETPSDDRVPIRVHFTLGEKFALKGYDLTSVKVTPGGELHLTLYWQAIDEGSQNYTVFVHLIDQEGQLWDQADAQPLGGYYPTSFWGAGELIQDEYTLSFPPQAAPGTYDIEVGMYLLTTGERLPVWNAEGVRMTEDRIAVGSVELVASQTGTQ